MDPTQALAELVIETDHRRKSATARLDQERRGDLGQFLTPVDVARLMASMFGDLPSNIRVLDAGAGVGALTASFVAEACSRPKRPDSIEATAFELDASLLPHLRDTLARCEGICEQIGAPFVPRVYHREFVEAAVEPLSDPLFRKKGLSFNAAILNPPYRKIGTGSRERKLLQSVGLDATNLYAAFVALSVMLLEDGGQLVAIIPRSFCNGPYFKAFRSVLLNEAALLRIHVFDSRKDAFKDDGVLQENVIIHVRRARTKPKHITISASTDAASSLRTRRLPYSDVVRGTNGDRFIHIPTNEGDDAIARWLATLPDTLDGLGLTVSTGRVVDFRARDHLRGEPEERTVPLIYPCHFSNGQVRWPKAGTRKPNAIVQCGETKSLLVPRGYYVLTKRFSSKEEKRRLVAAVYDPEIVSAPFVGFENHINYFHRSGEGLSRDEAYGLAVFLNSRPLDQYFRQFNGHTQVNATDLRSLRYPSLAVLRRLGRTGFAPGTEELEEGVIREYPIPGHS
jgi:adenine-specific DNA-methyltransferase